MKVQKIGIRAVWKLCTHVVPIGDVAIKWVFSPRNAEIVPKSVILA
jgi:hypothetical protein